MPSAPTSRSALRNALIYGLCGGLLFAVLRLTEYRFLVIEHIDEVRRQAASFKEMYDKPLMNAALTFTEPFPIGLVVSVISAAVLRKKPKAGA
jgi:hypothetical protein